MIKNLSVKNALVTLDDAKLQSKAGRWLDASGSCIVRNMETGFPVDDTTGDALGYVTTVVEGGTGDTLTSNAVTAGDIMLITNAAGEYDGINLQRCGSNLVTVGDKPLYYGIRCKISDATQSDLLVGICGLKTDLLNTSSSHAITSTNVEGLFFFKADGATTIAVKSYVAGVQTGTANVATAMDTDYHDFEIYYDGDLAHFFFDNVLVASFDSGLPTATLTPSVNFRNGAAAVKTMTIAWQNCIQVIG